MRRVLAAAHVAEATAALEEIVAHFVNLLHVLLDLTHVLAAALIAVAATTGEVVLTNFVNLLHFALSATFFASLRLTVALAIRFATLGSIHVLARALGPETAPAGAEVAADLLAHVAASVRIEAGVGFAVPEAAAVAKLALSIRLESKTHTYWLIRGSDRRTLLVEKLAVLTIPAVAGVAECTTDFVVCHLE